MEYRKINISSEIINTVTLQGYDLISYMSQYARLVEVNGRKLIFINDLTACRLKAEVKRKYKSIEDYVVFELGPHINSHVVGVIVERGLKHVIHKLRDHKYPTYRHLRIDGRDYIIAGSPDYIYIDNNMQIPIEVKVSVAYTRRAAIQARLYAWLLNAPYCVLLIFKPTRSGIKIREYHEKALTDSEVISHVRKWLSTTPLWENECKYCPKKTLCPKFKQ